MAKTNPYQGLDLERLAEACDGRAGELLQPRPRTAEERAVLAEDTALLLLSVARRIEPGWYASEPERSLTGMHQLADAFGAWHEQLQRKARLEVLVRAVNVVHGGATDGWIREARIDGERAYTLAVESDAGLARVLAHLQAEGVASGHKPGGKRR